MFVGHMGYFVAFANIYKAFAVLMIKVLFLIELTQPNFEDGSNETYENWVIFDLNYSFCIVNKFV